MRNQLFLLLLKIRYPQFLTELSRLLHRILYSDLSGKPSSTVNNNLKDYHSSVAILRFQNMSIK